MDYTWQGVYTGSLIALMAMFVALYRAHQTNIPGRCGVAGDEKADQAAQLLEAASMLLRNLSKIGDEPRCPVSKNGLGSVAPTPT